jgi:hypothetical protein
MEGRRKRIIILGILPIIATILLVFFAWNSIVYNYDNISNRYAYNQLAASATKNNPLGLEARVIHFRDTTVVNCPSSPCGPHPGWALNLVSDKPAWLLGYGICDADSCLTEEKADGYSIIASADATGLENRTDLSLWSGYVIRWIGLREDDSGATLPWKVGDTVHVIVKAEPAVMVEKNNIRQWEPIENVGVSSHDNHSSNAEERRHAAVTTDLGETRIIDVQYGP